MLVLSKIGGRDVTQVGPVPMSRRRERLGRPDRAAAQKTGALLRTAPDAATSDLRSFLVDRVALSDVEIADDTIRLTYSVDDFVNVVEVEYDDGLLSSPALQRSARPNGLHSFAVFLGVVGLAKFAPVLPRIADLSAFSADVHPSWIAFAKQCIPRKWSEHRYQLMCMGYRHPEFRIGRAGNANTIWRRDPQGQRRRVMLASGSGKDSLLCSLLLQNAGIEHDLVTYLFDLYGNADDQRRLFSNVADSLTAENRHVIVLRDNFYPWLEQRLEAHAVRQRLRADGMSKPFRTEAGEVYFCAISFLPIQVAHDIEIQLLGSEKSADAPNLDPGDSSEAIAHQWAKSLEGERTLQRMIDRMFPGYRRASLTKPIHDVRIFDTLFRLDGELPYQTNSCNVRKPWCGECEKCLYVFAGFCAFGSHRRTVGAFGRDLFRRRDVLSTWEELLGLRGYIPWECVGHPLEVQLYLWKCLRKGIDGWAIELFREEVYRRLGGSAHRYFGEIESGYGRVYGEHHTMPSWLWDRVRVVLEARL